MVCGEMLEDHLFLPERFKLLSSRIREGVTEGAISRCAELVNAATTSIIASLKDSPLYKTFEKCLGLYIFTLEKTRCAFHSNPPLFIERVNKDHVLNRNWSVGCLLLNEPTRKCKVGVAPTKDDLDSMSRAPRIIWGWTPIAKLSLVNRVDTTPRPFN